MVAGWCRIWSAHWWVGEDARSLATAWECPGVVCTGGTRAGGGGPRRWGIGWRSRELLSDARDAEGRGEQAQVAVGEAGGASGDVEAEANWPRDRSETPSGASASRKRKAPC